MDLHISQLIKHIYNAAAYCWNKLIEIAITLCNTSPRTAAGGSLYSVVRNFYNVMLGCTVPLATVFFIIAIYKEVVSSPPEQQAKRFLMDAFKYVMILYLSTQLWNVLGYIMSFADSLTSSVSVSASACQINLTGSDLFNAIDALSIDFSITDIVADTGGFFSEALTKTIASFIYVIAGLLSVLVMVASGISIINVAFQRIIKPLIAIPFSTVILGIGSCSGEGSRMMWHFGKNYLGFCLSGAFMILSIKLGSTLCSQAVTPELTASAGTIYSAIILTVQINLTAIVVSGLCKATDSFVARVIG